MGRALRGTWALVTVFVVESVIFGLAALPGALFWEWHLQWQLPSSWLRIVFLAMAFIPAYLLFAMTLLVLSAGCTRVLGWRTPPNAEMRIHDLDWPLLDWLRYAVSTHLVRVFAGTLFRASPVWPFFIRLNGGRIGRGVFINTLGVSDHNLLEVGDGTVIGSDVHLSGHMVEGGIVKTAPVRVGREVTIGAGSVISIGVEIDDGAQVGALSFVPKHARLEAGVVYAGIPVRRLEGPRGPIGTA